LGFGKFKSKPVFERRQQSFFDFIFLNFILSAYFIFSRLKRNLQQQKLLHGKRLPRKFRF
jgi:hypothetical protein